MYAIGTRVYVKSVDHLATVSEANWFHSGGKRHATYLVQFVDHGGRPIGGDFLTSARDLRNAEGGCCDGCGKYLPRGSFNQGATSPDGEYPDGLKFCFLCTRYPEPWEHAEELLSLRSIRLP